MNKLYILTGPAGTGKSTISYGIAQRMPKSVVIEGDTIYNFFVGGRIKPWLDNAPLDLFWKNCVYLINSYLENGYDVVFNYIINPQHLDMLVNAFKNYEIIFKCLITSEDELLRRDKLRPLDCQMNERCIILLKEFLNYNYAPEKVLDTTSLTIEETIDIIINNSYEAK